MEKAFRELADNIFGLIAFIAIMLLMVSVISSCKKNCSIVADFISTKASSSSAWPCGQEPLYISARNALYDSIVSPEGVVITVNGVSVNAEWIDGARRHDKDSLSILKTIFGADTWRKVTVIGNDEQVTALEFWKGGNHIE